MFTKAVNDLRLTSDTADQLFANIQTNGPRHNPYDKSFLATLRAIMHKRLPSGESICLQYTQSTYKRDAYTGIRRDTCFDAIFQSAGVASSAHGCLHVHNAHAATHTDNEAAFEIIDRNIGTALNNKFVALLDVAGFIEQTTHKNARVFISEEYKSTLVVMEDMEMREWHLLQSLLPRYFPWYMEGRPLDKEETALLKSLTRRYAPEYTRRIEEIADGMDFRPAEIRAKIGSFERDLERKRLDAIQNAIQNYENHMDALRRQLADYFTALDRARATEAGLRVKINSMVEGGELLDYVLGNRGIDIISASNGTIEFVVNTVISSFDPDLAARMLDRFGTSFFYRSCYYGTAYENRGLTDERIRRLMRAIFLDEIMQLRVCAAFRMDCGRATLAALRGYNFSAKTLADHTPNQHIQRYSCLGNNERPILEAMARKDYVGAMILCCASAANMNLTEANTGTYFMEQICANGVGKIIQMPDGSTATPLEAVRWLEQQDAQKENKKEEGAHEQTD